MKLERWVRVSNKYGLHARVATELVKAASRYQSVITLCRAGSEEEVDGKSILQLMSMGAENGAKLRLRVVGDDAELAMGALIDLFERRFDEE
jgi:phosphocarrier protein